jgi:hypothetical protein
MSDYFCVVQDTSIGHDVPYEDLMSSVDKYQTKVGTQCINRDEPVFKVTLIQNKENSYAVVVSLNHMIGDGYTFYKLSSMLGLSVTPFALNPSRKHGFKQEAESLMDPRLISFTRSPLFLIGVLYNKLFYSPLKPILCVIDKEYIESEKAEYKKQQRLAASSLTATTTATTAQFVSTNDILTSWFVRLTKCTLAGMVINFRNRLEGYTDAMAGNYVSPGIFFSVDSCRPEYIRELLTPTSSPPRYHGRSSPASVTSVLDLFRLNMVGVTNWACFIL